MQNGDDFGFWQWLIGGACTLGVALAAGAFAAGRANRDIEARLEALEAHRKGQEDSCSRQKKEMLDTLQKEICSIVRLAISEVNLANQEKLAAIGINVALHSQVLGQIQADVAAIFERMNRRRDDSGQDARK